MPAAEWKSAAYAARRRKKEEYAMGRFRLLSAVCLGRLAGFVSRISRRGKGAVICGAAARRIMPEILPVLAGKVREKIFVVTGTNGKTTVSRMLCESLEREGKRVVCNQTGANQLNGIVSAFVAAAGSGGELDADYACIEVDEMEAGKVFSWLQPDIVVLTNIFRDQLDRSGEVDKVLERLRGAVSSVSHAILLYNGDDCLARRVALQCKNPSAAYGIGENFCGESFRTGNREGVFCGFCGNRLEYRKIQYGQLGDYFCPGCGFKRPDPRYTALKIIALENWYSFELNGRPFLAKTRAPYQVYNILAAYSALMESGASIKHFKETVAAFDYGNGRERVFFIGKSRIQLHLAKNPVGFQQKLSLLLKDEKPKDLVIQINDEFQDGRDVSWLWDVDFEKLAGARVKTLVAAGSRRYDMELRLKYENIPCEVTEKFLKTVRELVRSGTGNLYVIVNYSGLYPANRFLQKLQDYGKGRQRE